MQKIIGLKKFREDVQAVAESVAKGNEYVVVKRSKPLFRVIPADSKANLAAWKKFAGIWKGRKIPDPLKWQRKIRRESERTLDWPKHK